MNTLEISDKLISFITFLPIFFLSLTLHEFSHAWSAYKLGDSTAKDEGRLTLNPIRHLDLVGSIIMPLMAFASGFAMIGWARPVPVDSRNFKNRLRDDAIVSFAGPLSNFILALLFFCGFIILYHATGVFGAYRDSIFHILWQGFYFNLFLFFFNLLPIPPLDGSHIIYDLFPNDITARLVNLGMYGAILLMLFIYSPLWGLFSKMLNFVVELFVKVAGL